MTFPVRRIIGPICCALSCTAFLAGMFLWQLNMARTDLEAMMQKEGKKGQTVLRQDAPDAAIKPTEDADDAVAHLRKGDLLSARGFWKEATAEYILAVDGGGLTALRKLAQSQMNIRDFHSVQETIDKLNRAGGRREDILLLESIVALRTGNRERAEALVRTGDESPQKHYVLGLIAIVQGEHDTAREEFHTVIEGWEPSLRANAKALLSAYDEFALFPESPHIHLDTLLARSLAQVQECEIALPIITLVTNAQDDYRDAWIVRGYCELMTGRSDAAISSLEQAYRIDPEKPDIQYFLGRAYAAKNEHQQAITFLTYAIENGFEPQEEARSLLAREAILIQNPALALAQEEEITKDPLSAIDHFRAYVGLAVSLGRLDDAVLKAQEAVNRWPQSADAYALLGSAFLARGSKDDAKLALEHALQLNPNLTDAQESWSKLFSEPPPR